MGNHTNQPPSPEVARKYVRDGIFDRGGLSEGWGGFWHQTIPSALGFESRITLGRLFDLLLRLVIFGAIALYPLILRKATSAQSTEPIPSTGSIWDGFQALLSLIRNPAPIDYVLGALALLITALPKISAALRRERKAEQHSPYYDLTAAIQCIPESQEVLAPALTSESIRLTLNALRDEMCLLLGEESKKRLTDVTLLEFCSENGERMQVRARTANHEEVGRPVSSERFIASYVARIGRNFALHDFLSKQNPFPATRVTVAGSRPVDYRSVLYMPIMCAEQVEDANAGANSIQVKDRCLGVICVHSSKAYRFWRWGDHKKYVGGFADVAFDRAMPYIALIKVLLERSDAPGVESEVS